MFPLYTIPCQLCSLGDLHELCTWATVHLREDEYDFKRIIQILELQRIQTIFETVQAQISNFKLRDQEILVLPEHVNWTDQADGQIRSRSSHLPCHKEEVVRYSQIRTIKRKTDGCTRTGRNADHPDFRAGFQERNEVSAADLSAPPNIPEAKWQQQQQSQQQQGSRVRFEGHPETDRAGRGS